MEIMITFAFSLPVFLVQETDLPSKGKIGPAIRANKLEYCAHDVRQNLAIL